MREYSGARVNAYPIMQLRIPGELQKPRKVRMAHCSCGGLIESYCTDLGYCQRCGAEWFIMQTCSRHDNRTAVRFTGRYMR